MNTTTEAPREVRMVWKGPVSAFMRDTTRMIDLEGAFRSGKTTAACWKVLTACLENPGMQWLICRYGDGDTQSKLKPAWRSAVSACGLTPIWDAAEHCDTFSNGSRVYIFGLKSSDQVTRYAKLRGMTLGGVYNDQTEELPHDVFLELIGRLSQPGYPHQIILTPNPPDENHWLASEFPEDNHIKGRKYYSVPIYANAHNIAAEAIEGLEAAYPPSHPKHRSAVLGKRGLNVIGKPVYGGDPTKGLEPIFRRSLHVRPLTVNPQLPLYEALDFGKHHPCVLWGQYTPWGQLHVLGGLMGQNLFLEDFAPLVRQYRAQWFPSVPEVLSCCDPAGSHDNSQGVRNNGIRVLQEHGIHARYKENSNAPDVRLAMVERLGAYMRKRTPQGEAFAVEDSPQRWLLVTPDQVKSWPFLSDGLEAGYVWDEHYVSVGSKQMRKPKKDGWYEHGQNCLEYLELNFGGAQPTQTQVERHAARAQAQTVRRAQIDRDPFRWNQRRASRGGY